MLEAYKWAMSCSASQLAVKVLRRSVFSDMFVHQRGEIGLWRSCRIKTPACFYNNVHSDGWKERKILCINSRSFSVSLVIFYEKEKV